MNVEEAIFKDVFDYLFDVRAGKSLLERGKRYLHDLFEKWDSKHLKLDEDFDDFWIITWWRHAKSQYAWQVFTALSVLKSWCTIMCHPVKCQGSKIIQPTVTMWEYMVTVCIL